MKQIFLSIKTIRCNQIIIPVKSLIHYKYNGAKYLMLLRPYGYAKSLG